jgi:glycosyltransferase involved in cell wall biosynthesis
MVLISNKIPQLLRPYIAWFVDISERVLSRLTDYIVTADENISKRFSTHSCVTTLFNYPRPEIFMPNKIKVAQLEKRYQDRIPIIYHGSISEERGLYQMIGAMEILKAKRSDIILLIVGNMDSNLLQQVKKEIRQKQLEDHIELIGWVPHEEIVNYITISRVGLVPFLPVEKFKKNISIKQFEYMACGVPVLGANLPPIASYITAANCGKLYNSTSVEALASGVIDMLQDEPGWKKMSEAGKKAIRDLWNWGRMEEKLFSVYEKIPGN